jgi:hypothetical protein
MFANKTALTRQLPNVVKSLTKKFLNSSKAKITSFMMVELLQKKETVRHMYFSFLIASTYTLKVERKVEKKTMFV